MSDPRETIDHVIEPGQKYVDDRNGQELILIFLDDLNALLRGVEDKAARLTKRRQFEMNVGAGRYKIQGEVELKNTSSMDAQEHTTINWRVIDGVGDTTAKNLEKNGYTTDRDVISESDDALLEIRGVGVSNLENIREYV